MMGVKMVNWNLENELALKVTDDDEVYENGLVLKIVRYDTIYDLHWKTDRQAASLI